MLDVLRDNATIIILGVGFVVAMFYPSKQDEGSER